MYWHIDTDIIALLVMCALYIYTAKTTAGERGNAQNRAFVRCLQVGIIFSLIDIASSVIMEMPISRVLYYILMNAYLLSQDLPIILWFLYTISIVYIDDEARRRQLSVSSWSIYGIYCLLVLSNPFTGWFFTLGDNFEYARGALFLPAMLGLFIFFSAAILLTIHIRRRHIPKNYPIIVLIIQPLILAVSIPVQLLNSGWLMIFPAYMLCLLLAFLFFQNISVRSERARLLSLTDLIEHFASGTSICEIDSEGKMDIRYISKGMGDICGLTADELLSRLQNDITAGVHPDDRERVSAMLSEIREPGQKLDFNYRYVTDSAAIKSIALHAEAVSAKDGALTVYATYTDRTELIKAELLLDTALTNTGVSIWEYDFRRRCIIQYQNSQEMHGFEAIVPNVPQSLVESGFVYKDSAEEFYAMYEKLAAGAPFAEGVFKVQTSDRRGYWYEHIRYTNGFDENGQPSRAIGMSTDETERTEAIFAYERELQKERGFMAEDGMLAHATFNLTSGEVLDYRMRDGSPVPEDMRTSFDYAFESADLLIDEDERERFLQLNDANYLIECFESGETELRQEYRRTLYDGNAIWVRNTLRLIRDPNSGDILLFEYWYDIESEKMAELMYHSIATDNYDFVARIDGRTRHFNAIAKAGLSWHMPPESGADADAVTRSGYCDCIVDEDRDLTLSNMLVENALLHLHRYGRYVFTYRITRPDGAVRYKKITQYYLDEQREIYAMLREDITELMRAETEKNRVLSEALLAANSASEAKSHFLSRVSHELRTPLNAIIGFIDLSIDAEPSELKKYLANSDAAAKQLLSIINDVLDVSSIESGKLKIAHSPFSFQKLITNLTEMYSLQCRQKGIKYETVLLTPTDDWFIGDALRVNQILLNLLNNAMKFTEQGKISLTIRQQDIGSGKVLMHFEIADTGCGMSEEMQQRLFKPFEQESSSTAQRYGGSGLGLSIVGSLLSMMDGVISVHSVKNEGTTFFVDIPMVRSEPERNAGILEGGERLYVLVVDDDESSREYISAVLSRLGVRHRCVDDGGLALDELTRAKREHDPYNIALIDWKMPEMNGLELCRHIRSDFGDELFVIIESAYEHYQADESTKAAGANMYVTKPLFQSVLFDLFATLTNGRIAVTEAPIEKIDLASMRILLAEDNVMNRMVAENLINVKFGTKCECASDGAVALNMFLASPKGYYDAILMDIQMPNMDGIEATRRIRASGHPDAADVQIIALTANAFSEDVTKSLSSGMNAHVSKPIEPEILGAALLKAFSARRSQS